MNDGKEFKEIHCWRLKALIAKRRFRRDIAAMPPDKRADDLMNFAGRLIPTCDGPICFLCKNSRPIRVPVNGLTNESDSM